MFRGKARPRWLCLPLPSRNFFRPSFSYSNTRSYWHCCKHSYRIMPKRAFYYHKFIFKFVLSVFACQTPWSGSLLTRFSIIGIEEELEESDRHLQRFAVSKATSNATCNASITTTYTSHDRFFVYPRFTKGPDIELAKMVASQDQNGYLALPRASSATPVTQDILNSVFTLTDGQLMVSSFLPGNAENGTMYGKVCEINQDIEDPRASVPPLARRSARWKNTSSMIANSSSSDYDRFLCHDGNAWNREPARQWQIQQTCLSKKVADILVPKVVSRADGDSEWVFLRTRHL